MACAPMVVDAFEPDPEPVAVPEACPPGSAKAEPGICGCDVPDDDFDDDGTPDCRDECPDNAGGIVPTGPCGCSGFSDTDACAELRAALRNLYTFDGTGTSIVDRRGGANGILEHAILETPPADVEKLQSNGRLALDGLGSYVDLPDGMISNLANATFEVWISWRGGDPWSRIFDFGDNGGVPVNGVTYLFLTPNSDEGTLRVSYSVAGPQQETLVEAAPPLSVHDGAERAPPDHVAVVIDRDASSMRLYSNGVEVSAVPVGPDLGAINDVNNWIGRSNYLVDPPLSATLIEFRIYDRALGAAQISASFQAGPGALD
jgi:hypothetical protein